jgi:hypothetical protein
MSYTNEFLKELGKKVTVNMPSVIALGYGPVSAERLAELVASNQVQAIRKENEIYYKVNPMYAV